MGKSRSKKSTKATSATPARPATPAPPTVAAPRQPSSPILVRTATPARATTSAATAEAVVVLDSASRSPSLTGMTKSTRSSSFGSTQTSGTTATASPSIAANAHDSASAALRSSLAEDEHARWHQEQEAAHSPTKLKKRRPEASHDAAHVAETAPSIVERSAIADVDEEDARSEGPHTVLDSPSSPVEELHPSSPIVDVTSGPRASRPASLRKRSSGTMATPSKPLPPSKNRLLALPRFGLDLTQRTAGVSATKTVVLLPLTIAASLPIIGRFVPGGRSSGPVGREKSSPSVLRETVELGGALALASIFIALASVRFAWEQVSGRRYKRRQTQQGSVAA